MLVGEESIALRMMKLVLVGAAVHFAPTDALAQSVPQGGGASAPVPRQPSPVERRDLEILDFILGMRFPADPAELPPELQIVGEFYRARPPTTAPLEPELPAPRDHADCIERRADAMSECDRVYQDAIAECDRIHAIEEEKIVAWYRFRIEQNRRMMESWHKRNDQAEYEKWWKIKLVENNNRRDAGHRRAAEERDRCHDSAIETYYGCVKDLPSPATR
ncbi:MAG: hypothetical protein RLY21_213 [Planctomycetota bacterium]